MTKAQMDIDKPSEPKSKRRSPPKVFQCIGYGKCNMVFTRQEHLNRHERKHTGEKPYQCIIPGCERFFTRNDNMRQHADRCPYNLDFNPTKRNPERTKGRKKYCEDSEVESPSPEVDCLQHSPELPPVNHRPERPRRSAPRVIYSSHPYMPVCVMPKRRLSAQDLFISIDSFEDTGHYEDVENGVDLTEAEYQALLGFKELHRAPFIMPCV